ncbi:MAG: CCA tRNA nucleotidyltransferase [Phycisphaeraceae bacterium]
MAKPITSARQAAVEIISELREQGYTAYLAGGCVRDALLGNEPKDYDVATDATPDIVQRIFPKSAAVGAAFGVVIIYTSAPKGQARFVTEVATFRAEGAYSDGRRPDEVRFTNAQEDASRRDFTINGLFAEPAPENNQDELSDRIIDYVNGRADLEAGLIRAIGDPGERFGEDYLRMLRAIRFASRLNFDIEPKTSAAIRAHARYLGQISRERIGQELLAMLLGPGPVLALDLLQQHKLDAPTLNEDPSEQPLDVSRRLSDLADAPTRLAGWLSDRHGRDADQPRIIKRWRSALSLSNEHRDELSRLLALMPRLTGWPDLPISARKRLAAQPNWDQSLILFDAMQGDALTIRRDTEQLANDGVGLSPAPLLTGDDLIDAKLQPGPHFKTLLDQAYDQQLEGQLQTRTEALDWLDSQSR